MPDMVKICIVRLLRAVLKILWVFPVNRKRLLFSSFNGEQYSDNPKYICEEVIKTSNDFQIVWVLSDPQKWKSYIPQCYKVVPAKGMRFLFNIMTAGSIIINNSISSYIPIRKKQTLLETWHGGGGLKRCDPETAYARFTLQIVGKELSGVVESSHFLTENLFRQSFGYKDCEFIRSGMPRNSILFSQNSQIRQKVFGFFGIEEGDNIALLLYAPTFRGSGRNAQFLKEEDKLDVARLLKVLEAQSHKSFRLLFRAHHTFADGFSDDDYLNATDYPDMQELLYASDVLLTDYSSCMWDMCLMRKPIFLYTPDLDDYLNSRGFYCDFLKLPFPIARDQQSLEKNISVFDQTVYAKEVDQYLDEMGSYEGPDSAKIVCDWLINRIERHDESFSAKRG